VRLNFANEWEYYAEALVHRRFDLPPQLLPPLLIGGGMLIMAIGFLLASSIWAQDDAAILRGRLEIREAAHDALSTLYEIQPAARHAIEHAAGYAAFGTFGIKLLYAGGQHGKGRSSTTAPTA
jgi:hypothetical protein